ncbi:hypothetical protein KGQ31_02185 [Patescibacteria group bacterium]|nr:hypothetical protein [Patescibacteria group bacterium]
MEILAKLFGSEAKVKIIRLFLFNPDQSFGPEDIAARAKTSSATVRREVHLLRKMGMVKGKRFLGIGHTKRNEKGTSRKKRIGGWILNPQFPYLPALQKLLINNVLIKHSEIIRRFNSTGRLKVIIVAGVFTHDSDSRVDILVVGDNLRMKAVEGVVRNFEAEIGKELRYAAFQTADFSYRLGMYDKLVRDILDYPHMVLLDRIGLPPAI